MQQDFSKITRRQNQSVKDLPVEIDQTITAYLNIHYSADFQLLELSQKIKLNKLMESLQSEIRVEVKKLIRKKVEAAIQAEIDIENALNDAEFNVNNCMNLEIQNPHKFSN